MAARTERIILDPTFKAHHQNRSRNRSSEVTSSHPSSSGTGLIAFKYNFKPDSAQSDPPGVLHSLSSSSSSAKQTASTDEWTLELDTSKLASPSSAAEDKKAEEGSTTTAPDQPLHSSRKDSKSAKSHHNSVGFRGTQQPARDVDCVLLWDEAQRAYVLHALESVFSFKLDRSHATLSKKAKLALGTEDTQAQTSEPQHRDEQEGDSKKGSGSNSQPGSSAQDSGQEHQEQEHTLKTPDDSPSKQSDSSKRGAAPPFKLKLKPRDSSSRSGSRAGSPHVTGSESTTSKASASKLNPASSPIKKEQEKVEDEDEEMELFAAMLEQKVEEPPTPLEPVPPAGLALQMAQETTRAPPARAEVGKPSAAASSSASVEGAPQSGDHFRPKKKGRDREMASLPAAAVERGGDSGTGSSGEGGSSWQGGNKRAKLDLGSSKIKALGGASRRKEEDGLSDSD